MMWDGEVEQAYTRGLRALSCSPRPRASPWGTLFLMQAGERGA